MCFSRGVRSVGRYVLECVFVCYRIDLIIPFHLIFFISSHFLSFHLISSHFISFHLISSHFVSRHVFSLSLVFSFVFCCLFDFFLSLSLCRSVSFCHVLSRSVESVDLSGSVDLSHCLLVRCFIRSFVRSFVRSFLPFSLVSIT